MLSSSAPWPPPLDGEERELHDAYYNGLSDRLLDELSTCDLPVSLEGSGCSYPQVDWRSGPHYRVEFRLLNLGEVFSKSCATSLPPLRLGNRPILRHQPSQGVVCSPSLCLNYSPWRSTLGRVWQPGSFVPSSSPAGRRLLRGGKWTGPFGLASTTEVSTPSPSKNATPFRSFPLPSPRSKRRVSLPGWIYGTPTTWSV